MYTHPQNHAVIQIQRNNFIDYKINHTKNKQKNMNLFLLPILTLRHRCHLNNTGTMELILFPMMIQ